MRRGIMLMFLVCVACQNPQRSQVQSASSKPAQLRESVKQSQPQTAPTQKPKPAMFGFNVLDVQKELCCSDRPGKLEPMGTLAIEGLTNDNWRFVLSCMKPFTVVKIGSGYTTKWATQDEWYDMHTASIEHEDYGDTMTIYTMDGQPLDWHKWATCTVISRNERAKDVAPIRVASSEYHKGKDSNGYEVEAWSGQEIYRLACLEGDQSPCVSVAPATYRGIRDGSELRLCDASLNLICTYRIMSERELHAR